MFFPSAKHQVGLGDVHWRDRGGSGAAFRLEALGRSMRPKIEGLSGGKPVPMLMLHLVKFRPIVVTERAGKPNCSNPISGE